MRVAPYYSLTRGIALEDLWHDDDECEIGLSIWPADRLSGKDGITKHCPYCQLLSQPLKPLATYPSKSIL
jgi:hypothetical protein